MAAFSFSKRNIPPVILNTYTGVAKLILYPSTTTITDSINTYMYKIVYLLVNYHTHWRIWNSPTICINHQANICWIWQDVAPLRNLGSWNTLGPCPLINARRDEGYSTHFVCVCVCLLVCCLYFTLIHLYDTPTCFSPAYLIWPSLRAFLVGYGRWTAPYTCTSMRFLYVAHLELSQQ